YVGRELDLAPAASDFPSWGEHLPVGQSASVRSATAVESGEVDLDGLDFAVSAELEFPSSENAVTVEQPSELDRIVEVAEGDDLRGLIVGEAVDNLPSEQDVAGMRLAETTHDRDAEIPAS